MGKKCLILKNMPKFVTASWLVQSDDISVIGLYLQCQLLFANLERFRSQIFCSQPMKALTVYGNLKNVCTDGCLVRTSLMESAKYGILR